MRNRLMVITISALALCVVAFGIISFTKKTNVNVVSSDAATSQPTVRKSTVEASLKDIASLEDKGALLEAKEAYQKLMNTALSSEMMSMVQRKLESLNVRILLSGVNIKDSTTYEVQPGDVLVKIAKKFNATVESIVSSNNIKENLIRPGMKLRILNGTFSIFVDKSQNTLLLKYNDEVVKTYSVATGTNNGTPVGTFKIVNKIINPPWYKDGAAIPFGDPRNILGARWMGFDIPSYGIHGTSDPQSIGKQATQGCVRMRNEEVEELYTLVPVGTSVAIVD